MKALSVKQPWAWLIANGYKDIENRSWKTKHRGQFAIHASMNFDVKGYEWVKTNFPEIPMPDIGDFLQGEVVGIVNLVDVVTESDSKWFFGPIGFVLEGGEERISNKVRGKLNFFEIDDTNLD